MASIGQPRPINLSGLTLKTQDEVIKGNANKLQQQFGTMDNTGAITQPVSTPKVEVPSSLSTNKLTSATTTPIITDSSGVVKNIQNTLAKYTAEAGANEDFIKGAIKASGKAETPELLAQYKGKKLGDVISGLGLGEKVGYTATPAHTIAPEAQKGTPGATSQSEWEKAGNTGIAPFSTTSGVPEPEKTPAQEYEDYKNNYTAQANEQNDKTIEEQGLLDKSAEYQKANAEYEDAKNQLNAFDLGLVNQGIDIKSKPILLGDINQKLAALDDKTKVSAMFLASNANTALAKMTAAKGLYDDAKKIVQDSAPTWYEVQKLALDEFSLKNKLDEQQKDDLATKDTAEFNKMKEGYMKITTPEELDKYKKDILSGKVKGTIQTDVYGNNWLKPPAEDEEQKKRDFYSFQKATDALYDAGKISDSERKAMVDEEKANVSLAEQANSGLSLINSILKDEKLPGVVGVIQGKMPAILSGEKAQTIANIDSLKNLLTLQNLSYLKGAMSDKDINFITSASSALTRTADLPNFKEKLGQIQDVFVRNKLKTGAYNNFDEYYSELSDQSALNIQKTLRENPDISQEDLLKELRTQAKGFNKVGGDTNKAIVSETIGGKTIKVSQNIADKLKQADAELFKNTGKHLSINQSFRTYDEQAKLYKELSAKGAQVAPAGKSFHEKGLAVDVSNWKEAEPYLRKVGLLNNLANDRGHFSYGEFA